MSLRTICLAVALALTASRSTPAAVGPRLDEELAELDTFRGAADVGAVVEERGGDLLSRYKLPEDRTRIAFQLAHVLGQSDIRGHSADVAKYARLALEAERDPVRRGTLYSYLASALLVDPAEARFDWRRRRAAEVWLRGYRELLALNLPDAAPPLPAIRKIDPESPDPGGREAALAAQSAQWKARQDAKRLRQLGFHRDVFVRQLAENYRRQPRDDDEIKRLAAGVLEDPEAAVDLMAKVLKD